MQTETAVTVKTYFHWLNFKINLYKLGRNDPISADSIESEMLANQNVIAPGCRLNFMK